MLLSQYSISFFSLFYSLSLPIASSSPTLSPHCLFTSHSSFHLPHLFMSDSLSTHHFIYFISSSLQLIAPLISYLNPVLEFYFWPHFGSVAVYVSKMQCFSLFGSWLDLWIQVCIFFLLDLWVLNHRLWFCGVWCFIFFPCLSNWICVLFLRNCHCYTQYLILTHQIAFSHSSLHAGCTTSRDWTKPFNWRTHKK